MAMRIPEATFLGSCVITSLIAAEEPQMAARPDDRMHHETICILRSPPALPDDVKGKRLYVHGVLDADSLRLKDAADDAARHGLALQMFRDAGAVLVETPDDADMLIIGDAPEPLPAPLPRGEMDPEAIARNVAARRKYETWHEKAGHLAERATSLGVQRVSVGDWLIKKRYHDLDPIDVRVRLALASRIPVNFESNKLVNVFDYWRNVTGLPLVVDWTALDDAGVSRDLPITLALVNPPAGEVLQKILNATPAKDLAYTRDDNGVIFVSRAERLPQWTAFHPILRADRPESTDVQHHAATALRQPMPARYEANTLNAVVPHICQAAEVQHTIDWAALTKAGIDRDSLVFLAIPSAPRGRVLQLVLRLAGYTADPFSIDPQGVVHIPAGR